MLFFVYVLNLNFNEFPDFKFDLNSMENIKVVLRIRPQNKKEILE